MADEEPPPPLDEEPRRILQREVSYDGGRTWRTYDPARDANRTDGKHRAFFGLPRVTETDPD